MQVAVLGLGLIGSVWARHWHADGHAVRAWNRTPKPEQPGWTADPLAAVRGADVVALVLADGPVTAEIVARIAPALKPGMTVCQHATIGVDEVQALATAVRTTGARFLDMPFTGSLPAAQARQNVFFCGDDTGAFAHVESLYRALSKAVLPYPAVGQAMTVKLVMNSVIANTFQALAEGLGLARAAGLSDGQFFAALDLNVAKSGVADLKKAKLEQGDFTPQFSVKHLHKDLALALRLAGTTDAAMPQTEHLLAAYAERLAAGDGDLDFSVLIKAAGRPR